MPRQTLGATALLAGFLISLPAFTDKSRFGGTAEAAGTEAGRSWPMLGGSPQRNLVNTVDKNVPIEWSIKEGEQKNIKWIANLGRTSYGGPVIAGGKVFVGTNNDAPRNPKVRDDHGVLMCFKESDGTFLWQALHEKLGSDDIDWARQGIASHPLVEGNRVYYVSNRCELICADTEGFYDGKNDGVQDEKYKEKTDADIVWRLDMIDKLKVFPRYLATSSPLLVGDLIYVITANGVASQDHKIQAPDAPSFVAVNKKTGAVKWTSNLPGKNILDGQWSNAVYAQVGDQGQVIFPGGDGWLYSFEPQTGKLLWKFDLNPKSAVYKPGGRGTRNFPVATPVIHDNKLYLGTGQEPDNDGPGVGHFWCIDITKKPDNPDLDLSPRDEAFDPKAEVNKNSALVWHYGGEIKPKPKEGRDVVFGRTLSMCAVHDGLVYIAEMEGYFHCLDALTGKKYWEADLKAEIWDSPLWVDGKVYIGTNDGTVFIFKHGKESKELGKVEMETAIKCAPVVCNGVLYIQTGDKLYAIAEKK